jgi:hypothetical protein
MDRGWSRRGSVADVTAASVPVETAGASLSRPASSRRASASMRVAVV